MPHIVKTSFFLFFSPFQGDISDCRNSSLLFFPSVYQLFVCWLSKKFNQSLNHLKIHTTCQFCDFPHLLFLQLSTVKPVWSRHLLEMSYLYNKLLYKETSMQKLILRKDIEYLHQKCNLTKMRKTAKYKINLSLRKSF